MTAVVIFIPVASMKIILVLLLWLEQWTMDLTSNVFKLGCLGEHRPLSKVPKRVVGAPLAVTHFSPSKVRV